MKNKRLVLLSLALLAGCDGEYSSIKRSKTYVGDMLGRVSEVCIDGVIYLIASERGITPKINADFYPQTCNRNNDIPN